MFALAPLKKSGAAECSFNPTAKRCLLQDKLPWEFWPSWRWAIYINIHICIYIYIYIYIQFIYIYIYTHIYIYLFAYHNFNMYKYYVFTYIYIYTHTNRCAHRYVSCIIDGVLCEGGKSILSIWCWRSWYPRDGSYGRRLSSWYFGVTWKQRCLCPAPGDLREVVTISRPL